MKKDAYYFPHDYNARNDEKILKVRIKYGAEGYGIYFMIIERLRENSDYSAKTEYETLAFELQVGIEKVKSIIEDFGLFDFSKDKKYFFSKGLNNRMEPLEKIRQQRSEAGRKSAEQRAKLKDIQQPFNDRSTSVATKTNKEKNIKEKKSKINLVEREREFYNSLETEIEPEYEVNLSECQAAFMKDEYHLETLRTNFQKSEFEITEAINVFFKKLSNEGILYKKTSDAKKHFSNWYTKQLQKGVLNAGIGNEKQKEKILEAVFSGMKRGENEIKN